MGATRRYATGRCLIRLQYADNKKQVVEVTEGAETILERRRMVGGGGGGGVGYTAENLEEICLNAMKA